MNGKLKPAGNIVYDGHAQQNLVTPNIPTVKCNGNGDLKSKELILELRNRIPIGLTAAQKLLKQTKFDVHEAESVWKKNQINTLAKKLSIKPEEAKELLQYVQFKFTKALSLYKERNMTDIENILESSRVEEQVLENFGLYISNYLGPNVKHGGWIDEYGFQKLPELIRDILIVWQWYAYYDYEGISVEQTTTKEVIEILDNKLELIDFAQDLRHLQAMMDKFYQKNISDKKNFEKYIEQRNLLISSEEFIQTDKKIVEMEEVVMKKIYEILLANSRVISKQIKLHLTMAKKS